MYSYTTLALFAVLVELVRRFCLVLRHAFFGPLSKVPGPFLYKITGIPWSIEIMKGNHMNVGPGLFEKYGDVVRIGPSSCMFQEKAGITKILGEEDFRKAPFYSQGREDYHIASLFSETDKLKHKKRRRILSPGFAIGYLNNLEPLIHDCVEVLTRVLDSKCDEADGYAVIDMDRVFANLTTDIMSAASFGGSLGLIESDDDEQRQMFNKYLIRNTINSQFPRFIVRNLFPPSGTQIDHAITRIINKRRQEMEKGTNKKDLLQILIDAHDKDPVSFTSKHLREEMIIFMIAGSDTASLTLTFTLLLLVNNPEKLKRLCSELHTTFPSPDDKITFSRTQELPYLNAVLNESMRVMPVITASLPRTTSDSSIISGYEIPGKTVVLPWLSRLQRDPRIWPDANVFIPERWLGNYKGVDVERKAFMPFSAGSRNCIGQQFALRELRVVLATVVRRYDLSLIPGQSHELLIHIVPYFKQGFYKVGLKRRV